MITSSRALFISHGGGPLPLLGDPAHQQMVECLRDIATTLTTPDALVVVSAHWEADLPTITSGPQPELIYDYYGFPPESYDISYPCPGHPALARELRDMLGNAGIEVNLDSRRGFDHGLFVPLKIMYPEARIPCVQLSLVNTLDPAQHIALGQALQGLAQRNILVVGSGFSFHNMKAFFSPGDDETRRLNHDFEAWLADVCGNRAHTEEQRRQLLVDWQSAPGARYCHPREEHLLPLHVCYGVAEAPCSAQFRLEILNRESSMFLWR